MDLSNLLHHDDGRFHYTDRVSAGHRRSHEVTASSELNTDSNRMTQPAKRSFKRKFRVCYPPGTGTLVIRTELNWERDVHPSALSSDGSTATFEIEARQPFVHFKPCLVKNGTLHWAVGTN